MIYCLKYYHNLTMLIFELLFPRKWYVRLFYPNVFLAVYFFTQLSKDQINHERSKYENRLV
jgi:hypothetical protein